MYKTKSGKLIAVKKITWDIFCNDLLGLNRHLFKIISKLEPSIKDFYFYEATYPYGNTIIQDSKAYLPLADGEQIYFNDPDMPEELLKDLGYDLTTQSPLGILLSKNCELSMRVKDRILPHLVITPGDIFGAGRMLNQLESIDSPFTKKSPSAMWDVTSGVKSTFMLAKISDATGITRLNKALATRLEKPKTDFEHFIFFKKIGETSDWQNRVAFFSNSCFKNIKDHDILTGFINYLLKASQNQNQAWHNMPKWMGILSDIDKSCGLDGYSEYARATAINLLMIAIGSAPGFAPSTDNYSIPLQQIQDLYLHEYNLDTYWPTVMTLSPLSPNRAIYYSLNRPTLAQYNPNTFHGKSIISLACDVKHILDAYCKYISTNPHIRIDAPSLYYAATLADFSFYHNDSKKYGSINDSTSLKNEDSTFACPHAKKAEFPANSGFFKGCVKITPKKP